MKYDKTRDLLDEQGDLAVYFKIVPYDVAAGEGLAFREVGFRLAWGASDAWLNAYQRHWDLEGPR